MKIFMVAIMNLPKLKLTKLMNRLSKCCKQVTVFVSKLALALVRLTHLIKLLNGFNQISGRSTAARSKM